MLYLCYLCRFKPLRDHLRGFLIAAWAGDKIAEFSFPEISFHFPLRPWFFFVSPAYAGKRACTPCCTPVCGDHPRMCGEKLPPQCCFCPALGITPAYAGKSRGCPAACILRRDHPRVCGEKFKVLGQSASWQGSPPHVRGKATAAPLQPARLGITPACAGKSGFVPSSYSSERDHPRMCGEKSGL